MKRYTTYFVLLFIFAVSITGCKKSKDNDNDNPGTACTDGKDNFPFMGEGHKYVYYDHYSSFTDTVSWTLGAESNGKFPVSVLHHSTYVSSSATGVWWACDHAWFTSYTHPANDTIHSFLSLDAEVGDTWTCYDTITNVQEYTLLSKNATITTPTSNQTYTGCYKFMVEPIGGSYADTIYVNQEVGEVYANGKYNYYELISKNF